MRNKLLILVLSFLVTACASTIGNKQDVKTTSFLIGDTSKNEVLDTLGLPSEVTRSEALQQEFWAYQDGPEFLGVIIAVPLRRYFYHNRNYQLRRSDRLRFQRCSCYLHI